jgi:putative ABC transport system permease protein
MTRFGLALSTFRRHKGRTIFTVLSVATAFAIFIVLAAIERGMDGHIDLAAAQRLNTEPAINAPLPVSYGATIRTVPHVTSVTYSNGFPGYFRDPKKTVFVDGAELPAFFEVFPAFELPADQKAVFMHDRTGIIVRDIFAEKMGWHVGETIPIQGGLAQANGNTTWLFHLDGLFRNRLFEGTGGLIVAHYEYINEGLPPGARKDTVDVFAEMVDDAKNVDRVAQLVDARFANSSPDTRTQTDQEETVSAMRQFGDIGAIITAVGFAVFASMLLITGNTMANSVGERLGEFAMMRALGFSRLDLTFAIFREAVLIIATGAALGILAGWGLVRLMQPVMTRMLLSFSLTFGAVAVAALFALVFAVATGILPSRRVASMPVAATLRRM